MQSVLASNIQGIRKNKCEKRLSIKDVRNQEEFVQCGHFADKR